MTTNKTALIIILAAASLMVAGKSTRQSSVERVERGKYLVSFGGCNNCHTPFKMTASGLEPDRARMLSGHPEEVKLPTPNVQPGTCFAATDGMTAWAGPWGVSYAANLTPDSNTGLGIWTEEMFLKTMKTGKHMGSGREILPPMPWQNLSQLKNDDLRAIFAYLRSIPAVQNHVPDPLPPSGKPTFE